MSSKTPEMGYSRMPLVTMCVYNYNYGRYLRECLDSIFAQTYANIEICFSDNNSTDDSWEIALEYEKKYPGIMTVTRNRRNFGGYANLANCLMNIRGKYFVEMCSDDILAPDYVKSCVEALEANPGAGYALVHRMIIDEHGKKIEDPPFYNQSCLIPGAEQAAVYMMAAVNPSVSQIMYNTAMAAGRRPNGGEVTRWYGARILDFNMCCEYDVVYFKEPLLYHRLHLANDSFKAAQSLMEIIGPYVLQHQFANTASLYTHMDKAVKRLPAAQEKLGLLSFRYSVKSLIAGNEDCAFRYYHLAAAISPGIINDEMYNKLQAYWTSDESQKSEILQTLKQTDNLATRSVSYDPPPGSIPLQ
jgi:glycosyltransferase involved in cell wall biosynthesis